jgi:uncharacterized protein
MRGTLEALSGAKTILLTTYKRVGTPVSTPVSIAFAGGRAFFRTWHKAWKTRRLANNPEVEVAPCTLNGEPAGPAIHAPATLLSGDDKRLARRALARGHPVLQAIVVPLSHRLMRYRTMHYELEALDRYAAAACAPVASAAAVREGCRGAVCRPRSLAPSSGGGLRS